MAVSSFSKKNAITSKALSSLSELDRAYSPSLWNNRGLSSEETIQRHVSTTLQESKKATEELYSKINLQYGSTLKNVLDLYSSSSTVAPGAQLIAYVHGGYWQFLSKEESAFLALPICSGSPARTATIFLAVDYVLASEKQYGQQASITGICQQMQELFTFVGNLAQVLQCRYINYTSDSPKTISGPLYCGL
ncbi:hypothetical protein RvY_17793-3 [Ramazzottius varieornatus]|uniref:Alpha/beta hydrolase fold-3 domain-containing protein n=1 Tax=Ramazzottius varieornatus TaxID=947166 RepID=A0A1D1W3F2_RAMVA|nr:hypothetical protein RvY_17793-3 [Ramazzottius varieornatus]